MAEPGKPDGDRVTAVRPSTVTLPERPPEGVATVFDFFLLRFPRVPPSTWEERFAAGKVWADGRPVTRSAPYQPLLELHYRREVVREPPVRTDLRVVSVDHHLLVVDKPPHLPVTPGGRWVRHCLLHLLLETTGDTELAPLHRLDRLSSGLVVLSRDPATRGHFARLFAPAGPMEKTYSAVCVLQRDPPSAPFVLEHHVARSPAEHWRQVAVAGGPVNARAQAEVVAVEDGLALLSVRPATGRKHQIRVQLAQVGLPILGDPLYGSEPSYDPDDLSRRLWLDACRLAVDNFPAPGGGAPLRADWRSSRPPREMLRRAVEQRRHGR